MLVEFEKELLRTIKGVCDQSYTYLGEFENKEALELLIKGGEAFVFVEFVDENYENLVSSEARYNIHILTCTLSKNQTARQENRFKALLLCERIDKTLLGSNLCNEFQIRLKDLKANINRITDYGYIYVISRQIVTNFADKNEAICNESFL